MRNATAAAAGAGPPRDGERAQPCHEQALRQRPLEQADEPRAAAAPRRSRRPRRARPGARAAATPVPPPLRSSSVSAAPRTSAAATATTRPIATRSSAPNRPERGRATSATTTAASAASASKRPGDGAARLEQGVSSERPLRRTQRPRATATTHASATPATVSDERLRRDDETPLPQRHAEQRQPSVRRLRGSPQPRRGERCEREQQRSALTAEQQQPARTDRGAVARRGELLRRRDDVEADGCRPWSSARARAASATSSRTLHGWTSRAVQPRHPAVAPVGVREVAAATRRRRTPSASRSGGARGLVVPDDRCSLGARRARSSWLRSAGTASPNSAVERSTPRPTTTRPRGGATLSAQLQHLAARSSCTCAGVGRSSGGPTARDRRRRRTTRSALRRCSRGRAPSRSARP